MPLPPGVYQADHVGSFLRPTEVKKARKENADGKISATQLRAIEDQNITTIIDNELQSGLRSITDGEARRAVFHLDFLKQIGGIEVKGMIKSTSSASGYTPPRLVVTFL